MNRKSIFDIIRRVLGRPFRPAEVDAIDAALDVAQSERCKHDNAFGETLPGQRRVGPEGISLIKRFEGCARRRADGLVEAYPDPGTGGEPWTIGWGATGAEISRGTVWTQAQCDERLEVDLARYAAEVDRAVGTSPTTQNQFDALVSFHYNTGAIGRATLTRKHIAGDLAGAAREFDRWCYAGGRVMKGLARRRAAEAALYRKN